MTNWMIETFDDFCNFNRVIDTIPFKDFAGPRWQYMTLIMEQNIIDDLFYSSHMMETIQKLASETNRYYTVDRENNKIVLTKFENMRGPKEIVVKATTPDDFEANGLGDFVVIHGSLRSEEDYYAIDVASNVTNIFIVYDGGYPLGAMKYLMNTPFKIGEVQLEAKVTTRPLSRETT